MLVCPMDLLEGATCCWCAVGIGCKWWARSPGCVGCKVLDCWLNFLRVSGMGSHEPGVVIVEVFRMCIGAVAPICITIRNTRSCSLHLWFLIISLF